MFAGEPGGHRWQRIPPSEKRGRVHTSTVTVAVLPEPEPADVRVDERDLEWTTCRGSGPGGQHRNKTETAVTLVHRPTGTRVRIANGRSLHQNKRVALAELRARLWAARTAAADGARAEDRRRQLGTGMRGDKRRTVRCQDGVVTDHLTGHRWPLKSYLRGEW